tara:strand:- start:221 stop:604 length:384 start_codon:yes stop_codon:yes gene_type:complete
MNKKLQEYKKSNIRQKLNTNDSYDIIKELLSGLNTNLKEALIYMDKNEIETAKERARKADSIATALQNCLDIKNGGEIAENLNTCYRHIRFAAKNYIEREKSDLLSNAHFVSNELLEGWKGMNSSVA